MAGRGSGYYTTQPRPEMFQSQSSQLPPPSQLHQLASSSSFQRENQLAPISSSNRFPPASYHPSLSSQGLPPIASSSSASSSAQPWQTHRTSSSRDDRYPSPSDRDMPLAPSTPAPQPPQPERRDSQTEKGGNGEENLPSTSDFVKKLYKMLEDQSFQHVVSWGPHGDCFVVKDMNEFTKSILPRMFKHSNFASFVRQLNKYDFHKVKNTDDNAFGEHSWTFRHPDFHADRRDALENIKRKVPAARKSGRGSTAAVNARGSTPPPSGSGEGLQAQVERLLAMQDEMASHIRTLEANYQGVVNQMIIFQQDMARQDHISKMLITCYVNQNNGGDNAAKTPGQDGAEAPPQFDAAEAQAAFLARGAGQLPMVAPDADVARASFLQMNEISRRAAAEGLSFAPDAQPEASGSGQAQQQAQAAQAQAQQQQAQQQQQQAQQQAQRSQQQQQQQQQNQESRPPPPPRPPSSARDIYATAASLLAPQPSDLPERPLSRQETLERLQELHANATREGAANGSETFVLPGPTAGLDPGVSGLDLAHYGANMHEGLQVYTLGQLLPRSADDSGADWAFDPTTLPLTNLGADLFGGGFENAPIQGQWQSAVPPPRPQSSQSLRVRRSTYVPGWSVPPRVLLVEDDVVSRRISGKFLQVFGVSFDIAVDGLDAIQRLNLNKYDLVLMDIVMPKLDGVTATSIIRQSDRDTPIISMTSNSKPHDLLMYHNSGMTAHLPKPFTKTGLLSVLEKYIMNFQEMRQLGAPGLPPALGPAATIEEQDDGETVPGSGQLAGTSAQAGYDGASGMNGEAVGYMSGGMTGEKRAREDDIERDSKRGRFEIVE